MKALVIGGLSGTIGKAVSLHFKKNGYDVIDASRSTNPALDITNPHSIEDYYQQVDELDAIISTAGDAAFASLDKLEEAQIQLCLNSKLMGQVNIVRKGLSKLRPNGVFVITGGTLAYTPMPQTSMIALVNAGLEGFVRAVALEMTEGRRIVIVHPPWLAETATELGMDATPWPNAAKVAEAYLEAAKGYHNGVPVFVEGYKPAITL